MSFEALTNHREYLSAHYLAEVLPGSLKKGLLAEWVAAEKKGKATARQGLRGLRQAYFATKTDLVDLDVDDPARMPLLCKLHQEIRTALGLTDDRLTGHHLAVVEAGWADDPDDAADPEGAGRLLEPVQVDPQKRIETGFALASHLFTTDDPPRYVVIHNGAVLTLADRHTWAEGRYLAVSLDVAFGRNETRPGGELDVIAALFAADSLLPPEEGGDPLLAAVLDQSRQHAVGVSSELREGLRLSVELIANEILHRVRDQGVDPTQLMEPRELARELGRESLRYLYRILFLLYAEARPELGVLPVDDPDYVEGYSLQRLGELVSRKLGGEQARQGFHLYESLDLLFRMVNDGHHPRGPQQVEENASEGKGIRFEPLHADLFLPEKTKHIGRHGFVHPDDDEVHSPRTIDTRLRNATLYQVLRLLMLTRGKRKERGGFISYAQLGINQLGAVYEGLMSYSGFIAAEELYEVAKNGDPKDGSWMIPASTVDEYDDAVFVTRTDEQTGAANRVRYPAGAFVYRLAGRDRQTSASYYTPQSLTEVTVQLALKYRLDQDGTVTPARELLDWTICEPALGSGAFLNEAINQVAAEYLRRRQAELGTSIDPDQYATELQKVKAYIALHNSYGVDLNATAVELAEVSLWLNVMHKGLQAPWFGLHLRRGNSLIGGRRQFYLPKQLTDKSWLTTAPTDHPLRSTDPLPTGAIHHFLLPADGWGAVAGEKEARALAPEAAKRLGDWRRKIKAIPTSAKGDQPNQLDRLKAIARRVELLWDLVRQRLALSEQEIRRDIAVWGADDLPPMTEAVRRDQIKADLEAEGSPYWRLKLLMDAWCSLWFWPLDKAALLDGTDPVYAQAGTITHVRKETVEVQVDVPLAHYGQAALIPARVEQLPLPDALYTTVTEKRTRKVIEEMPAATPLADLNAWIDFAEAVVGTQARSRRRKDQDTLAESFQDLASLTLFEELLPDELGMVRAHRLFERFPWLEVVHQIAKDQGFFHWEVEFAHTFARGGFDLQAGNPPWVRPLWDDDAVLAEYDPWFKLEEKPIGADKNRRRGELLEQAKIEQHVLQELTSSSGQVAFFGSPQTYPMLTGTQPDLYRAFMSQVWAHTSTKGTSGLLHPDTHFTGEKEGPLRAAAYHRLRIHGDFVNSGQRFFPRPVGDTAHFGVHVYGQPSEIRFDHLSWLVSTDALRLSRDHDGSGEIPGIRYQNREFDGRPHRSRVITVDEDMLSVWRRLLDEEDRPLSQARLLFPVSTAEAAAIEALAAYPVRLAAFRPQMSPGFHETNAKKANLIEYNRPHPTTGQEYQPTSWSKVILKGVQLGLATPVFKRHDANSNDPNGVDLVRLPPTFVPDTEYVRVADQSNQNYRDAHDRWVDHAEFARLRTDEIARSRVRAAIAASEGVPEQEVDPEKIDVLLLSESRRPYVDFYRMAWRRQIAPNTERALYAALIPPGPAHIHAMQSLAMPEAKLTALVAGFWASLPVDYFLRATGRSDLLGRSAKVMPAPQTDHPLAAALLLRSLRLNCLIAVYADLWAELFDPAWLANEHWALDWQGLPTLNEVTPDWRPETPLRTERARRAALVEIDALVAVWLGMDIEALIAAYRGRFPVLQKYEAVTWFDATGWKLAGNARTMGQRQSKEAWAQFESYLQDPDNVPLPHGYTPPFYKADREGEYRQAHAVFSARLQAAKDAGWEPSA